MAKEKDKRIEKATDNALQLFTDLGLTLGETWKVAERIISRAKFQSECTKLDLKEIRTALEQDEMEIEEVRRELQKMS
jgi:hypothetical protein